jgi:transposase-like protein
MNAVGQPERGISKEKVCVSCAVDRNGQVYSRVSALGKPTAKALEVVFRKKISMKSVVCTDSDRAYIKYAARSPFKHVRVPNGIRKLGIYHVQNINAYHSRLKGFMRKFKGVATKYLEVIS